MKFLFLILILLSNCNINSQSDDLTTAGDNYLLGEKFLKEADYDSAFIYLKKAGEVFYQTGNLEEYIVTQNKLSYILRVLGDADSSLALSKNALQFSIRNSLHDTIIALTMNQLSYSLKNKSLYMDALNYSIKAKNILDNYETIPAKAENYSLLGLIYDETARYDSALIFYNKAIAVFKKIYGENHSSIGSEFNNIAAVLEAKGDFEKAYNYYLKCLEIKREAYGETHREVAVTYNNIGANCFFRNEYDLAIEFYLKSISVEEKLYEQDNPSFAYKYNNIAMVYRVLKDYEKALEYSLKAKNIFSSALGKKHLNTASVINNIGKIYFDKKEYDKALEYYFSALQIFKETLGGSHPAISQIKNNIGETYTIKGEYYKGNKFLKKVLAERKNLLGSKHSKVAETFIDIGMNFLYRNITDSALFNFQQAVIISANDFNLIDVKENPDVNQGVHDEQLLKALALKGETFYRRYLSSKNLTELKTALDNYKLCSNLVTNIRQSYKSESSKILLTKKGFDINTSGISVAKILYDLTGDTSYFAAAFKFAEDSKAGILSDALLESNAKKFAGIPDSLLEKERQLKIDLTYFDTQIQKEREKNNGKDSIKIKNYESLFFTLRREYEDLIKYFENNFKKYYQLKHKEIKYSAWEIQKELDEKSALLEYVISNDTLNIFMLRNNSHSFKQVHLNTPIKEDVESLRNALYNLNFRKYTDVAYKLYKLLISPVENELINIEKLYIIPDGILNYLPFESLLTSLPENFDFEKMNYLINNYEFGYYFSASMLNSENHFIERNGGYLGFAPVFNYDSNREMDLAAVTDTLHNFSFMREDINAERFSPLPETEYEVSAISKLFKQKNLDAKEYLNSQATEQKIKSGLIEDYNFIHIASHGFIREDKPELSGIAFWNNPHGIEDGILYSDEIYNLKLNAGLVVLSACETGLGKIVKGEGIIGLTRGFIYSGAKNILVSLWRVADKSTSELMVEFYKNILSGKDYSSSLREAKLKLIKDKKYSYPLEWSPFVLIGN